VTLAPLVSPEVRGVEGKPGDVQGECVSPGCHSQAQQRHHLWPKSYLRGQPYEWVRVNGRTIQNSVGLCVPCHLAVTGEVGGHRAHIRYDEGVGLFEWWAKGEGDSWFFVGPLDRQQLVDPQPEVKKIRAKEGLCPECGRPLPHEKHGEPGPRRKVTTWGVLVPDDAEVGSDVLDDQIEQFAALLGFGEAPSRLKRYHVIALVLAWAMLNGQKFLEDLEEAEYFTRLGADSLRASHDPAESGDLSETRRVPDGSVEALSRKSAPLSRS